MFTLTHPDRIKGLILISTGAKLRVMPQMFEVIKSNFEAYVGMMEQFAASPKTPREVLKPVQDELRKRDPKVVFNDFKACDIFNGSLIGLQKRLTRSVILSYAFQNPQNLVKCPSGQHVHLHK